MQNHLIRLNKLISESGTCSRREADKLIESGKVMVNNTRASIGQMVKSTDKVRVNGIFIEMPKPEEFIFIALNKPTGVTSTTEEGVRNNITDFVNHSKRIFPIGRLDKDSQGLIFLTNNGDIVNKILRAGNNHEKEYIVHIDKPITEAIIKQMSQGVPMLGVITKKCKVELLAPKVVKITLIQGLNRQIRRMCEYFGYEVMKLERVRIMNIELKGLAPGEWRDLSEIEVQDIFKLLEKSSSEDLTKKKPGASKPKQSQGVAHSKGTFTAKDHQGKSKSVPVKKSGSRPTISRVSTTKGTGKSGGGKKRR
jgi:23S rRNA pseudouridine2604 synthase